MLNKDFKKLEFTKGSVYWANLHKYQQSSVQSGVRPVVVISSMRGSLSSDVIMVAPLTTRIKPLSINANIDFMIDSRPSQVLCSQIQTVPKSALFNYVGEVSVKDLEEIEKCILIALGIAKPAVDVIKSNQEALAKQKEDRQALNDLIPRASQIIKELTEIIDRQTLKKVPKNFGSSEKKKGYRRRTPEETADFIREWEDSQNNRNEVAEVFGFSGYAAAYNFYWNHKHKLQGGGEE